MRNWSTYLFYVFFNICLLTLSIRPLMANGKEAIVLMPSDLSAVGGNPSLVTFEVNKVHIPVWSLSGGTVGQSVIGLVPELNENCSAVQIQITILTNEPVSESGAEAVFSVHLSQIGDDTFFPIRSVEGDRVRVPVLEPFAVQTVTLESFYTIKPGLPISIRVERHPDDPADTFTRPMGLVMVKITPVEIPEKCNIVQDIKGYNSWPMIQSVNDELVVIYSRGTGHSIEEDVRAVYARSSYNYGKTWTDETVVTNLDGFGEVAVGKGLDEDGRLLVWVRQIGSNFRQALFRRSDDGSYEMISLPELDPMPIQITDIFSVPGVGLMALWFAGPYADEGPSHSWGTVVSTDNGVTWTQNVIESNLPKADWPTEQAAAYLGDGRIFAVARTENGGNNTLRSELQLYSTDSGRTWKRDRTNITDVLASTPSLIYDSEKQLLSLYYYHRGRDVLRRRVVNPDWVIKNPLLWPDSEGVAVGSDVTFDAGNVNSTVVNGEKSGKRHALAFYSGKAPDTAILMTVLPAPEK